MFRNGDTIRFPPERLRLQGVLEPSEFHDGRRIMKRHQFKADKVLGERLIKEARLARKAWLAREKAEQLPTGEERAKPSSRKPARSLAKPVSLR